MPLPFRWLGMLVALPVAGVPSWGLCRRVPVTDWLELPAPAPVSAEPGPAAMATPPVASKAATLKKPKVRFINVSCGYQSEPQKRALGQRDADLTTIGSFRSFCTNRPVGHVDPWHFEPVRRARVPSSPVHA